VGAAIGAAAGSSLWNKMSFVRRVRRRAAKLGGRGMRRVAGGCWTCCRCGGPWNGDVGRRVRARRRLWLHHHAHHARLRSINHSMRTQILCTSCIAARSGGLQPCIGRRTPESGHKRALSSSQRRRPCVVCVCSNMGSLHSAPDPDASLKSYDELGRCDTLPPSLS
jgi:hypothetical protein